MDTGTLEILKNANQDNLNMTNMKSISKIHGIGKVKVKKLSELGIKNVQHLYAYDKQYNILNNIQKIGLKYHEDLEKRIPREEMREYEKIFKLIGSHINVITKIVGSYRRGALTSGDIDILVSDNDKKYQNHDKNVIDIILNILQKCDIRYITLSKGDKKFMGIIKLKHTIYRRVDIVIADNLSYPFTLLYFTGSGPFNINMRRKANEYGYTLNEYGLFDNNIIVDKMVIFDKIGKCQFDTERDIFNFLDMKYLTPDKRI